MMKMSEEWNYGRNGSLLATKEVTIKLLLAALSILKDGALARSRNGLFTHMTETEAPLARLLLASRCPGIKGHTAAAPAAASPPCLQFQTKHLLSPAIY